MRGSARRVQRNTRSSPTSLSTFPKRAAGTTTSPLDKAGELEIAGADLEVAVRYRLAEGVEVKGSWAA